MGMKYELMARDTFVWRDNLAPWCQIKCFISIHFRYKKALGGITLGESMIFNFSDFKNEEQNARLAAICANNKVRKEGHMVYGNAFTQNGKLVLRNFTEEHKESDTHVAVLMGLSTMGSLPVVQGAVKTDEITEDKLQLAKIEALEASNRELTLDKINNEKRKKR